MTWLTAILALIGSLFMALAALGIVRYPDSFMRMQALGKATTLGLILMLLATAIARPTFDIISRALLTVVFLSITTPLATHLLARAAYASGVKPWRGDEHDEYAKVHPPRNAEGD